MLRNLPSINNFKQGDDGYERFRKAMIEQYGKENGERITLAMFTNRHQLSDQSLREYAKVLSDMAEKFFTDNTDEHINNHL